MTPKNPFGRILDLGLTAGKAVVGQVNHLVQERRGHAAPPPSAPSAPPAPRVAPEQAAETGPPAETSPNPARIAQNVAKQTPEQKALQEAATPRRTPVRKAAPGAKLPPRKPAAGE